MPPQGVPPSGRPAWPNETARPAGRPGSLTAADVWAYTVDVSGVAVPAILALGNLQTQIADLHAKVDALAAQLAQGDVS